MKLRSRPFIAVLIAIASLPVAAADVGLPFSAAENEKPRSAEIYFEHLSRNVSQDYVGGTANGEQDENRYIARVEFRVGPRTSLSAEAGATDSDAAQNTAPLIGAGVRYSLCDNETLRANLFASGKYVSDINYKTAGNLATNQSGDSVEHPFIDQTESYFEFAAGAAIARDEKISSKITCTPYGGLMLSKLRGNEDYKLTYRIDPRNDSQTGHIRDSGSVSIFAGIAFAFSNTWGVRIETRVLNQSSYSAGLTYFF
jgi:hypothetical protein